MHLYALSLQHPDQPRHGHGLSVLRTMSPDSIDVSMALEALAARGLAQRDEGGLWAPTELGLREGRRTFLKEAVE